MKTKILFNVLLPVLILVGVGSNHAAKAALQRDTITVFAAPGMSNLAGTLVTEYGIQNQEQFFEVKSVGLSQFKDAMNEKNSLGFISQRPDVSMVSENMWRLSLGRNVAITSVNNENPFAENFDKTGISPKKLADIISGNQPKIWGSILGNNQTEAVHFYTLNDPTLKLSVSKFLDIDPSAVAAIESKSSRELLETLKNDKYAIAFCQLATITNINQQALAEYIKLLPLDRNGNERIDYNENIYGKLSDFERAVWIGKYPKELITNIYAVSRVFPENENITDFLSWIVTSGQQLVALNGYTDLVYSEKQSNLNKLNPTVFLAEKSASNNSKAQLLFILVIAIVVFGLLIVLFGWKKNKASKLLDGISAHQKIFDENLLGIPKGLYFDKTHTWIYMEKDGEVKFGINDFIPKVTGDFTQINLKNPGERVRRKEPIVTLIQKGKQININSPVSGTIKEINEMLVTEPNLINNSPYNEGWVYSIEPSNWGREIRFFKMGEIYKEWIRDEFIRLKDFLVCSFAIKGLSETSVVYQEGGEIISQPLKDMSPEIWEDFQNYFINAAESY